MTLTLKTSHLKSAIILHQHHHVAINSKRSSKLGFERYLTYCVWVAFTLFNYYNMISQWNLTVKSFKSLQTLTKCILRKEKFTIATPRFVEKDAQPIDIFRQFNRKHKKMFFCGKLHLPLYLLLRAYFRVNCAFLWTLPLDSCSNLYPKSLGKSYLPVILIIQNTRHPRREIQKTGLPTIKNEQSIK